MHHDDRVKLLGGPYRSPRCKLGRPLRCHIRDKVKVRGLTDGSFTFTMRNNMDRCRRTSWTVDRFDQRLKR